MADLDDFFAKKDRKKNKIKKFSTTDEIAKKLDETSRKSEKLKKDKLPTSQGSGQEIDDQGQHVEDEDEWKDFEEEKKDYTGLKIQNLTIVDDDYEGGDSGGDGDEDGGMEENEAGEMVPKKKQGPWKQVVPVEDPNQPPREYQHTAPMKAPREEPEEQPRKSALAGGSYVPPALRRSQITPQMQPSTFSAPLRQTRMKTAPDVNNEELFPSLSSSKSQDSNKKKKEESMSGGGFEEVRNSKSHSQRGDRYELPQLRGTTQRLALGNKFGALNHDQS